MIREDATTGLSPMARPLVQRLVQQIRAGILQGGRRLPTVRDLAREHGVSYRIARQAIIHLENTGLVETLQGSGTYVARRRARPWRKDNLSNQVFIISNEIPQTYAACVHPIVVRLQAQGLLVVPLDYGRHGSRLADLAAIFEQWQDHPPRAVILKTQYPPVLDAVDRAAPVGTCRVMSYVPASAVRRDWHLVTPEPERGFHLAAQHLLAHGHRRIGLVTAPPTTRVTSRVRLRNTNVAGALRAFHEAQLPRGLALHVNRPTTSDPLGLGRDAGNVARLARWMTRPDGPTGFIATDHRAVCIKMAAQQAGMTIGRQIDLVTYGEPTFAQRGEHACVIEPHDLIAEHIVRIVLDHDSDEAGAIKRIMVPPRLLERQAANAQTWLLSETPVTADAY